MNDMVVHQNQLTARDIRANVNLVQEVMREVMKDNVHYGVIPGTKKPTLYKSGAEVLCVTFRVADIYVTEDLSTPDCFRYRVICSGIHQTTGFTLGSGVGECSSDEEKYKWRKPVHNNEYEAVPENRRRLKYNKDGGTWKQVRTEPADLANTILKMAAKRAKIAMTLNVIAASDCFTQDIEDLPEEMRGDEQPAREVKPIEYWSAEEFDKNLPAWSKPIQSGSKNADYMIEFICQRKQLTEEQKSTIRAVKVSMAKSALATPEQLEDIIVKAGEATITMAEILKQFDIADGDKIPASQVDAILAFISDPAGSK